VFATFERMTPPPRDHRPEDAGAGASVASVLREVADLVGTDPAEVPDAVKRERLLVLCQASGLLDAVLAREVGVFDANTVWAGDGKRTAASWITSRTEVSPTHARAIARAGRDLRSCPLVEAAWASGRIGTAKATALLRASAVNPGLFAVDEAGLVDEVEPMTVTRAEIRIAEWIAIAEATRDAQAAEDAGDDPDSCVEADPMADNALHLSQTFGGRWVSDGSYDPVTGAEIHDAITAEIDARFHNGVYRSDDGMSPAQRRAECEHALITRGANPTQTRHGEARPSVSVEIDAKTLAGLPITDAADAAGRHCQLADGTPIARSTVERLLCTCRLTAIATKLAVSGEIEVIGITDWIRDATAKQRKALNKRDGGCVFTGCNAPFAWCEAHHLWQHELGGPTLIDNLVLLCKHHHHLVHEGGWHLWRAREDGQLHLRRPDGTPVPMARHGHKVPDDPAPPQPPPPMLRNGPPRHLTKAELAELEARRQHRRRQPPPDAGTG
jgi:hypothetical protein